MPFLPGLARRLNTLARYLERPELIELRLKEGLMDISVQLNQPWLQNLNIQTVLDIGAHTGRFAVTIHSILPKAQIYAFEPLPECFIALQNRMKDVPNFTAFNLGLGDQAGSLAIEQNTYSPSSSFLKLTKTHQDAFPNAQPRQTVTVTVEQLDAIVQNLRIVEPLMIKIDVQGYEDRVFRGGEQTFKRSKLILTETSFEPLYAGQPLFDDIYRQLNYWGFRYAGSVEQLCNPQDGRILQADSLFIKP